MSKCQRDFTCKFFDGHAGDCEFTTWPTAEELKKHTQVGGTHYDDMDIQPWEVIRRAQLDFWEGNVVKYVMRYKAKNGLEDLKKAQDYLNYLIEREQQK